jgi:hypothetical protein
LVAGVAFAVMAVVLFPLGSRSGSAAPSTAEAQNLGFRVVAGFVSDAGANPVDGATVFLKNLKSKNTFAALLPPRRATSALPR